MNVKAKISIRLILMVMGIGFLSAALFMYKSTKIKTNQESINLANNTALEQVTDIIRNISFIQAYIANFEVIEPSEWLTVAEKEISDLEIKIDKVYNLAKKSSIAPTVIDRAFNSRQEFSQYSKDLIASCREYIAVKRDISELEDKITTTAEKLENASSNISQGPITNDISKLNLTEKMYFLQKDDKTSKEAASEVDSLLDNIENSLQQYLLETEGSVPGVAREDLYGYILYGQVLDHKKLWDSLHETVKKAGEVRANLMKDLQDLNNSAYIFRLDLSHLEKALATSIQDINTVIYNSQKRAKLLTIAIIAIFVIGIISILASIRVPTFKKLESPVPRQTLQQESEFVFSADRALPVTKPIPEPAEKSKPKFVSSPNSQKFVYSEEVTQEPIQKTTTPEQQAKKVSPKPLEPIVSSKATSMKVPSPIPKISAKDIQELKKIMVNIVELIYKDKNNFSGLTREVYSTENYLYNHSVNVAILAVRCGLALGLAKKKLVVLGMSALLHDIGLTKVPKEILDKRGKLTRKEYSQIKKHPTLGLEILKQIEGLEEEIKFATAQHHERQFGQGYPEGLSEDDIHLFAKIIGLVDIYEALIHTRVYRSGRFTKEQAIEEIQNLSRESFFDEKLISVFLKELALSPTV
jgi:putative nucleotidyltransferase with HDIG domain